LIQFFRFKAIVVIWDFETKAKLTEYQVHHVCVEYLAFTAQDRYLVSLGGRDDARVVVCDLEKKEPICGKKTGHYPLSAPSGFTKSHSQ